MKSRLNIHSRVSESGSSTTAQKKPTAAQKKQTAAQAARTQPTATSTPAPEPAPTAAPSTGSTARTLQTRTIAQEPSQENGSEEGQGSSGLQAPSPAEFRKKVKKDLRNRILDVTEDHENQEEETEAKREMLASQRKLTEMQIKLAKIRKEKQAKLMQRTKDDLATTMSNSLAMGLDQLEDEFDETAARLRAEQERREVELINLDDSTGQDEIAAMIAFSNEVIVHSNEVIVDSNEVIIDEDTDDEEIIDDEEFMDQDVSRVEPATRTKRM